MFFSNISLADEYYIITNRNNPNVISKEMLRAMYLGETNFFPDGKEALIFNRDLKSSEQLYLIYNLLHMNEIEYKSYWHKKTLKNNILIPTSIKNDQILITLISSNINSIGIVKNNTQLPDSVRIVHKF